MRTIERNEAIQLMEEALSRIKHPSGREQTGGAYWRLAVVLGDYLSPRLEANEGKQHADFIRETHGVIIKRTEGAGCGS